MIPGANLGLGALNPALQKFIAGGTRFATDDEADIKILVLHDPPGSEH